MAAIKRDVGPDRYALLMPINEFEQQLSLALQQNDPLLRDGDNYGNFRSPGFRKALAFYANTFEQEWAPKMSETQISNVWDEFFNGFYAFYLSGPWNIREFRKRAPPELADEWGTMALPGPDGPGAGIASGTSLVIFRSSKHKDAAWKWIEFLSRPDIQQRFHAAIGDLPPRRSTWEYPSLANDELRARLPRPARAREADTEGAGVGAHRAGDAAGDRARGARRRAAGRGRTQARCAGRQDPGEAALDRAARRRNDLRRSAPGRDRFLPDSRVAPRCALTTMGSRRCALASPAGCSRARHWSCIGVFFGLPVLSRAGAEPHRLRPLRARRQRPPALRRARQLHRPAAHADVLEVAVATPPTSSSSACRCRSPSRWVRRCCCMRKSRGSRRCSAPRCSRRW